MGAAVDGADGGTLAERLRAERRRRFVGRGAEVALFRSALSAPLLPFNVLYLVGPGGVGKSALLAECESLALAAGWVPVRLDGRSIAPEPGAFIQAVRAELRLAAGEAPFSYLASRPERHVLFIDTFEALQPIEEWLRERFLPQLPDHTLTVLASRHAPELAWRTDPGWRSLLRIVPLESFSRDETGAYLESRGVPQEQEEAIWAFTQGHPLALSMIADLFAAQPGFRFEPEAALDIIGTLVKQFVERVPSPDHRRSLGAGALARVVTEGLLAKVLGSPSEAAAHFEWLQDLSFVETGAEGLFLHELARNAILTDLRWRNPDEYAELRRRARDYYIQEMQRSTGGKQERALRDYLFLHRDRQAIQPFVLGKAEAAEWEFSSARLQPEDIPAIVEMVRAHEGEAPAKIARHWIERQPQGTVVLRTPAKAVAGFVTIVALHEAGGDDLRADPAIQRAKAYLAECAPPEPGEAATYVRYWMSGRDYQSVSPAQKSIFVAVLQHCLMVPRLAFTFLACADPDFWEPLLGGGFFTRAHEADFSVGGRSWGVFVHDWRTLPPQTWLTLWTEGRRVAELSAAAAPDAPFNRRDARLHTREALRHFCNPDKLRENPLIEWKCVARLAGKNAGAAEKAEALRKQLAELVESLKASPRRQKLYRALYHTYLEPEGTQEEVAEFLDLPMSTYRGHLTAGIELVADLLWRRELDDR